MVPKFLRNWFGDGVRSRSDSAPVLLWMLRGSFGIIVIGMALFAFNYFRRGAGEPKGGEAEGDWPTATLAFAAILMVGLLVVATDLLVKNKQITTISAVYFGLLMGLLLGSLFAMALEPIVPREWVEQSEKSDMVEVTGHQRSTNSSAAVQFQWPTGQKPKQMQVIRLILTLICCYICISLLLQTKDEFRFIIPYVEFSKQLKGGKPMVLDTSVIIDGRIADICETRFIDAKMVVPRFVLQELQGIADSSDKLKRNRGRRGLDMLKRMQTNPKVELQLHEGNLTELRDVQKVDERLVVLAKVLGARVVTNDFNLNKIAQLQGVEVINLNELSNALKSVALPGETLTVRIVRQGDQLGQGVGYLDDGTMVVVEQGRQYIGQEMNITVTSVLQTSAGRMIFGRVDQRPAATSAANHQPDGPR